jgi:polyferredoxin
MPTLTRNTNSAAEKRHKSAGVQNLRRYSQLFALAVNVWIGLQFYFWVKWIQSGAQGTGIARPPGVEGWLPIGSLVSLRYYLGTGIVNTIHPAGLIILATIIFTAWVFKKGFCSWVCPIGFISEMLANISDKLIRRRIKPARWLDYPLRSLKYILLGFFIYAVFMLMSFKAVESFLFSDYNIVSDILMLHFFTDISMFALIMILTLLLLSLVVRGFWCRYLCPYGALLGLFSLISPTRIRRNVETCIDCAKCAKVCPAFIKVDKVREVVSDECVGCIACVDACPVEKTLEIKAASSKWTLSPAKWAAAFLIVFWGVLILAGLWGPWQNGISTEQYKNYMPGTETGQYAHPGIR